MANIGGVFKDDRAVKIMMDLQNDPNFTVPITTQLNINDRKYEFWLTANDWEGPRTCPVYGLHGTFEMERGNHEPLTIFGLGEFIGKTGWHWGVSTSPVGTATADFCSLIDPGNLHGNMDSRLECIKEMISNTPLETSFLSTLGCASVAIELDILRREHSTSIDKSAWLFAQHNSGDLKFSVGEFLKGLHKEVGMTVHLNSWISSVALPPEASQKLLRARGNNKKASPVKEEKKNPDPVIKKKL